MSSIPAELKYTKEHEWIRLEGDIATVGITDFAQAQLGDVVFVEIPETGDTISEGDTIATVESTKTAADIFAPLSGEIIEANEEVGEDGDCALLNSDPYGAGWIFKMKLSDISQADALLSSTDYEPLTKE
jgi:glycine cleavage system H protein